MPALTPSSPSRLGALHLLRALLREASYLPDATARNYFRRYIVSRFKAYQPKENATASFDVHAVEKYRHRSFRRRQLAIILERARPLLRKGNKGLNFLRRANLGERPCLYKILLFTYGRLGRRKYALLENLLKPDPVMSPEAVALPDPKGPTPLQVLYFSNKRYLQFFDAPKVTSKTHHTIAISDRYSRLRTVIQSQSRQGIALNRDIKTPALVTPINNIWERPMPIKRARNNVGRWYAETLTRLLPPLPTEEWDSIQAMVSGEKRVSLTRRRVCATELSPVSSSEEERFTEVMAAGLALDKPSRADRPAGIHRPHNITARYMRRIYFRLLTTCCKLEYDYQHKRWKAIWGDRIWSNGQKQYAMPTDTLLFEGVDAKGQVLEVGQKRTANTPTTQTHQVKLDFQRFPFWTEHLPETHPLHRELNEMKRLRASIQARAGHAAGGD